MIIVDSFTLQAKPSTATGYLHCGPSPTAEVVSCRATHGAFSLAHTAHAFAGATGGSHGWKMPWLVNRKTWNDA